MAEGMESGAHGAGAGEPRDATAADDDRTARADTLALYALLPPAARRALRALRRIWNETEQARLAAEMERALLRAGFEALERGLSEAMPDTIGPDATEEEITAEAIRIVRDARAAQA